MHNKENHVELDGSDIKYLLEKHGYNYSKIARDLKVNKSTVHRVANGELISPRVKRAIEKALGLKAGTLKISREQRPPLVKVA